MNGAWYDVTPSYICCQAMREGYLSVWIILRATSGCSLSPDGYCLIFLSSFPFVITSLFFKSFPNHSPDLPAGMPANILAHWQYVTAWRGAKKRLWLYTKPMRIVGPLGISYQLLQDSVNIAGHCSSSTPFFLCFLDYLVSYRSSVYIAPFETVFSTRPVLRPWFRTGQRFILVNRPFPPNDWL